MSTRITQSMTTRTLLSDLASVSERLARTREKLASGKELTRPSDDPFAVSRALGLRADLAANRQHQRNVEEAVAWQTVTDSALAAIGDITLRVRELTIRAANGSLGAEARASIATELAQLTESVKNQANARYAGRYVFAGTETLTRPYPGPGGAYAGDAGALMREIGPGVELQVNVTGASVIGDDTTGLLKTLADVQAHLAANDAGALSADLAAIDAAQDSVMQARAVTGARANRLETALARLVELEDTAGRLLSETEDADMAKTLVDASTQQSVYESALRAGAGIVQTSLLDFLR
jgi:flagellar hook-associated protein 3 FlgL